MYNSLTHWLSPKILRALNAVARATSSGFWPKKPAISSTIAGKAQGSLRWNVQYRFTKFIDLETKTGNYLIW